MWWAPLIGLATSLIGNAMSDDEPSAPPPPPRPKPEFQPMQRQPMTSARQPFNFDPGASGSRMDPNDTRLQAIASLKGKLGL